MSEHNRASSRVYILGGTQTDFARSWSREGKGLFEMITEASLGTFDTCRLDPTDIGSIHVGNFTAELFCHQGQLGGLVTSVHPDLDGIPASRHEAACASGGVAILAACADIASGNYETSLVVGVEQMRHVTGQMAAAHLAVAAWEGREALSSRYLWPAMFDEVRREYDLRHGLQREHLVAFARNAFTNARDNPLAQTRNWTLRDEHFSTDETLNGIVEGEMRRHDCSQITDGAVALVLASESYARDWCAKHHVPFESIAVMEGWGHRTATLLLADKLARSAPSSLMFPQLARAASDARTRAGVKSLEQIHAYEVHDCFSVTGYIALEHLGLASTGESWKCIESGDFKRTGRTPINPSGGLMGIGHPVGATGVRMVLDAFRQVTHTAEACQIPNATRVQTLNLGGSATTTVSFVIARAGE